MNFFLQLEGVGITVRIDLRADLANQVETALACDYGFFQTFSSEGAGWRIQLLDSAERIGNWLPAFWTPRSVIFISPPGVRRIRFFGKSYVECDFKKRSAKIFFDEIGPGYESLYFVLESILTLELDRKGLHRLHGFGALVGGEAVVVLGKSGAGKSTLFSEWCKGEEVRLLGDDLLITDQTGVRSYPAKISFKEFPQQFPSKDIRVFDRQRYGRRFLLDAKTLSDRFELHAPWKRLVLLQRDGKGTMQNVGRFRIFWWLFRWMVLGLETPQIAELFLPVTPKEVAEKLGHLYSRLISAWRISGRVKGNIFHAPNGKERMAQRLQHLLTFSPQTA